MESQIKVTKNNLKLTFLIISGKIQFRIADNFCLRHRTRFAFLIISTKIICYTGNTPNKMIDCFLHFRRAATFKIQKLFVFMSRIRGDLHILITSLRKA